MKYGEFGESYCSEQCYKEAKKLSASLIIKNHTHICEFCKSSIKLATNKNYSVIQYEGKNIFICNNCAVRAKNYFKNYFKCCNCKKYVNKGDKL
jgi:hypothetical protein